MDRPEDRGISRSARGVVGETEPNVDETGATIDVPPETIELEDALEAARGLAELVREEFPARSLTEIVETWTPAAVTEKQRIAIARLERAGVWAR